MADLETQPERDDTPFARYVVPEIEVLHRVARSITHHDADAEDLVQDTLLRAFRAIDRFDGRHPRAWLLTIMRNAHVNKFRRRRPGLLRMQDDAPDPVAMQADPGPGPEQTLIDSQFDSAVEEAYRALPEKFREVIDLVDLADLSYEEAARTLGIPQGTVMSRLHRGRRRIREALGTPETMRGDTP